jgi:hypothetical protein
MSALELVDVEAGRAHPLYTGTDNGSDTTIAKDPTFDEDLVELDH